MKLFQRGTPQFGLLLGLVFAVAGLLVMTVGFWKTVLLALLFAAGYYIGAVDNKSKYLKDVINRVVPEKKNETIDFRAEIAREQEARHSRMNTAEEAAGTVQPETADDADETD